MQQNNNDQKNKNEQDPNNNKPQGPNRMIPRRNNYAFFIIAILIIIAIFFFSSNLFKSNSEKLDGGDFNDRFENNLIVTMNSRPVGGNNYSMYYVYGEAINITTGNKFNYHVYLNDYQIAAYYQKIIDEDRQIVFTNVPYTENIFLNIFLTFLPYILIIGFLLFMFSRNNSGNNKAFDFAKSRARLNREKSKTFKDVAGCDEEKEELVEIIDFLKNPRKYLKVGARIPKGVLLVGPPGTGKTLLAKAVAGEASVPFFSISGSDFVEMFVGVGASRVRDLFKVAKENSPCIIFIDEIDAVGRQRGAGMGGGHDEREQTLNQLLVEMDGFGNNSGIIMMAATNRPDVLDPALLRPGRFDRQIMISNPDVRGREEILKVHARNKHFDDTVHFDEIARRIPGFSGADIENLLNEAALLAARANREIISAFDIDEATDRVMMGPAKKSRKITQKERQLVAYHEAGHAVIGLKLDNANIVQKVTIIPRGIFGGYNLMVPEEEKYIETKKSLLDRIVGYLGGRVSEEIIFNEISTGAHNDFQNATKIARAMVTEYGMSELGPVQYETDSGSIFLGRDYLKEKNFSDQVAHEIDKAVRQIITECYSKCMTVINDNIELLKTIAEYLLKIETLTEKDIKEIEKTGKLKWYDDKNPITADQE